MMESQYLALPKVELHNHFDGACRLDTLIDMCRKEDFNVAHFPYTDREAFRKVVSLPEPQDSLVDFLKPFKKVAYILGTAENLERQGIEFCEDQKKNNVVYTEVRLCPFIFSDRGLSHEDAFKAILAGLTKGQAKFDVQIRIIICFLKQIPDWSPLLADLAIKYKKEGVVGVDIAGDELQPMDERHIKAFKKAADAGLHITVHAGESGPAANVREAIEVLKAERIGHGYHVLDDDKVYQLAKERGVHFEVCLTSSIWTKSSSSELHSVKQFLKDDINFGLNTDDSGIIGTTLTHECDEAVTNFGFTRENVIKSMFNAAQSSFLPDEEKAALLAKLAVLVAQYRNTWKD